METCVGCLSRAKCKNGIRSAHPGAVEGQREKDDLQLANLQMVGFPKPYKPLFYPLPSPLSLTASFRPQGTFSLIIEAWHAPEGYYPTGEYFMSLGGR